MKKWFTVAGALLLLASPLFGQDIVVPASVKMRVGHNFLITAQTKLTSLAWLNPSADVDLIPFPDGKSAIVCIPPPDPTGGRGLASSYRIAVYGAKLSDDGKLAIVVPPIYIDLLLAGPVPPDPKPGVSLDGYSSAVVASGATFTIQGKGFADPTTATWNGLTLSVKLVDANTVSATAPTVTANATAPVKLMTGGVGLTGPPLTVNAGPAPNPSPFAEAGFRVMIVYDAKKKTAYPKGQIDAIDGGVVRDYLIAHCVKAGDGWPEYRIWSDGIDTTNEPSAPMKSAFTRKRGDTPWLMVGDGVKGFEGPLPATVAETMAILTKIGGP